MSSTNRGRARRANNDTYPTQTWVLDTLFQAETPALIIRKATSILEPTAGDGRLLKRIRETQNFSAAMTAVEIREGAVTDASANTNIIYGDFLGMPVGEFDVAISNPPFSIALEIIERSIMSATDVFMLERLNFLETKARYPFLSKTTPDVYIISAPRPSFQEDGQTDSCAYTWLHWCCGKGTGHYELLPPWTKDSYSGIRRPELIYAVQEG